MQISAPKNEQTIIVLIVPTEQVERILAQPFYITESLASEGFIHTCTKQQIKYVVNRFYNNEKALSILEVDETLLTATVKYETATNDKENLGGFPHVFGPINTNAITKVSQLTL